MKHMPNRALIVIGAALALGIGGGIAAAQIPSSTDGTITACMVKPGGTIRLIDTEAGATCKKGEQVVEWNAAGQPGAAGVSGYEIVTTDKDLGADFGFSGTAFLECPDGKKVIQGGVTFHVAGESGNFSGNAEVRFTSLLQDGTVFSADVVKQEPTSIDIARLTVACANVATP